MISKKKCLVVILLSALPDMKEDFNDIIWMRVVESGMKLLLKR